MRQKATAPASELLIEAELSRALPTPVRRIAAIARAEPGAGEPEHTEMWVKDDGVTAASYGGNKIRKLVPLLRDAVTKGKRRVVTFGAAGSHHVLATTLFARAADLATLALLTPQPRTAHSERILRCAVHAGVEAVPVSSLAQLPRFVARLAPGDYFIGPGAMGSLGASGYVDAALELAGQIERAELPEPDWIVLATGSGSTAAGLLTGLFRTPLRTRLLGVLAARNPAIRPIVLAQVLATARLRSIQVPLPEASARIDFETGQLGAGYGHPVEVGEDVKACAQRAGVVLDPTYTGKAFASALALARRNPSRRVLFWNTHSSVAPSSPARDTHLAELPPRLLQLLLPSSPEL